MIPNGGEAFGTRVPQIVGLRRGPERAYPSVGERGPQKQRRDMGCMGAEGPSSFGISHLDVEETLDMADTAVRPIPEGYHSLTPTLTIRGAAAAIDFYKRAFGAVEHPRAPAPDGTSVWHADLQIGDSRLMLSDEFPDQGSHAPAATGAVGVSLWLYVEDADAVFQRAVDAGREATR